MRNLFYTYYHWDVKLYIQKEENVAGINCHKRNLTTFVTASYRHNLFSALSRHLIHAILPLFKKYFSSHFFL